MGWNGRAPRRARVYVVDGDAPARERLSAFLSAYGFEPVAFRSAKAFLASFAAAQALCVFTELRQPGLDGIELQRELLLREPDVPVVFLTAQGSVPSAVEAMKAGAVDFIEKPAANERILEAVEAAARRLDERKAPAVPSVTASERMSRLTGREREVLDHLVLGMTNKHVAELLGISQRTVEIHRARIREKTEARTLADLIAMGK